MLRVGFLLLFVLTLVIAACSNENDHTKILGHWKSERIQVQSLHIPFGPEFVITTEKLASPDGEINIPISSFSAKDSSVIINMPLGFGLDFNFVSKDRMYFDTPFAEKIYFERVYDNQKPVALPSALSTAPVATVLPSPTPQENSVDVPQPVKINRTPIQPNQTSPANFIHLAEEQLIQGKEAEVEETLLAAQQLFGQLPLIDYYFANLRVRQNNPDAALQHLSTAFKNGFRQFALLNGNPDFSSLKADPRYVALVARYQ